MKLKTSLIGSYPPIRDLNSKSTSLTSEQIELDVRLGIERAIKDQVELGVDLLVDGQVRDNWVTLFTHTILGFSSKEEMPNRIVARIEMTKEPISVADFRFAKKLAKDKPFKAHIAGPMTIVSSCIIDSSSPYRDRNDPQLFIDLATALGQEVKYLVSAGAELIQIDEPILSQGADLKIAFDTIKKILEEGNAHNSILHVCGDIRNILKDVMNFSPTNIISIEGEYLSHADELKIIDRKFLIDCQKQIGLGCISASTHQIERAPTVHRFVRHITERFGDDRIWAITPNCGLRLLPYEIAKAKLKVLVETAHFTEI